MSAKLVTHGSGVPAPARRRGASCFRPLALGWIAIAIAIGTASGSPAAVEQTVATSGGAFGPSARNDRHPKTALARMDVPDAIAAADGGQRLCASYERPPGAKPDKGNLSVKVEVLRDGERSRSIQIPKTRVIGGRVRACAAEPIALREGDELEWRFLFKGMPKVPGGDVITFGGEVLAPAGPFGSFRVAGDEADSSPFWIDGANLVFCRTDAGFADLWIRLAAEGGADGENGPHVDLDVCNYAGGGNFSPLDPQSPSCGAARTFDVFWHDEAGDVWANVPEASPCELVLIDGGATLSGTFVCKGLQSLDGAGPRDLLGGAFECRVD